MSGFGSHVVTLHVSHVYVSDSTRTALLLPSAPCATSIHQVSFLDNQRSIIERLDCLIDRWLIDNRWSIGTDHIDQPIDGYPWIYVCYDSLCKLVISTYHICIAPGGVRGGNVGLAYVTGKSMTSTSHTYDGNKLPRYVQSENFFFFKIKKAHTRWQRVLRKTRRFLQVFMIPAADSNPGWPALASAGEGSTYVYATTRVHEGSLFYGWYPPPTLILSSFDYLEGKNVRELWYYTW